jgi:hypothetical protein
MERGFSDMTAELKENRREIREMQRVAEEGFSDVVTELKENKRELRDMQREWAWMVEAMHAEEYRPADQPEVPEDAEELHVETEEVRDLAAERAEQEALAGLETEKEKKKVRKEKKGKEKKRTEDGAEGGEVVEEPEGSQTMRE